MRIARRETYLWVFLSIGFVCTVIADRSSKSIFIRSRRYQALRRHQRSALKVLLKRDSNSVDNLETHMRILNARRLRILQLSGEGNDKAWWGQWSSWSACGRTCGSGVQFQQRHCLGSRIYKRGKILCSGSTRKYRICSTEPCPPSSPSFRRLQCHQLASRQIRGRYYSWKPYGHPDDEIVSSEPCQLVCISRMNEVQTTAQALDGTECRKGWDHGRCVRGKCQFIGCDGKIDSTKLRDECGNCGEGNETSCELVEQHFQYQFTQPGEIQVVRIPKDSYDILILEKGRFSSDIILKDLNGTVLFNGGGGNSFVESGPRNVYVAGAEFRYRKPEKFLLRSSGTYLLTIGPIQYDVVLHVARNAPGQASMRYEFKVPRLPRSTDPRITSLQADNQIVSDNVDTVTTSAANIVRPTIAIVSASPALTPRVRKVIMSSEEIQGNNWETEDEESFLYIREFRPTVDRSHLEVELDGNATDKDNSLGRKKNQLIFTKPKLNATFTEDFNTDSDGNEVGNEIAAADSGRTIVYQGNGETPVITRESVLGRANPGGGRIGYDIVEVGRDSPTVGVRSGSLGVNQPDTYSWISNGFAPCSSTCSGGLQDSYTQCEKTATHEVVDDSFCDPRTRPEPVRQSCKSRPCEPRWEASPWSECSTTCGPGEKSRTVRCWKMISAGFDSTIYNELCANVSGEKPNEVQPCQEREHCGPLWETSQWSTCHAPCDGVGSKQRHVICSAGSDNICAGTPKPHAVERCKGKRCLMKWIVSDWGECTGSCGGGRKTRKVMCFDNEGRRHPEHRCDVTTKPETSHPCGDRNCRAEWITQDWEECSTECGIGMKKRSVLCSGIIDGEVHHYNNSDPCNMTSKPVETQSCQIRECDPMWLTTPWSKCSVTCGSGRRVREANCYRNGSPTSGCDISIRPPTSEPCQGPPCPKPTAGICKDKTSVNCKLVARVNLCSHWYYQKACCSSCRALLGHH